MKLQFKYMLAGCLASLTLTSCHDWLTEEQPAAQKLSDFFTSGAAATQAVNGCYVPMTWDLSNTYDSEWWIGDTASDDAIKGGQYDNDMPDVYDIENFKTVSGNGLLLGFYRAQFKGISRCNVALEYIPKMTLYPDMDEPLRERLLAEAKFLRAFYFFRLVRIFGGVPMPTNPVMSSSQWKMPREKVDKIYTQIVQDLTDAEAALPKRSEYTSADLGRATKGAAAAMLMKVNLYLKKYDEVLKWGKTIMNEDGTSSEYSLSTNYFSQFLVSGENSPESVFEIQHDLDPYSDYGGDGYTRGTFTVILTRPRTPSVGGQKGWGFNRPSLDLYQEFEANDPRRDWTVITLKDDEIQNINEDQHFGNRNYSRKYMYEAEPGVTGEYRYNLLALEHDSRGPLNHKEIRYAEVLLMYAEACIEGGLETDKALTYINLIRGRAGLDPIAAATREALRHERRCELAMEGHRWFDLCRWGIVAQTMTSYKAKYATAAGAKTTEGDIMSPFIEGKHELMPIPEEEIRLGGLQQNPNY